MRKDGKTQVTDSWSGKMRRGSFTYYFKEESVTLEVSRPRESPIGKTYVSFNCYSLQSRKKFKDFKSELAHAKRGQYNNLNDIYGLAHKHGIRATGGHKPTMTDRIAF